MTYRFIFNDFLSVQNMGALIPISIESMLLKIHIALTDQLYCSIISFYKSNKRTYNNEARRWSPKKFPDYLLLSLNHNRNAKIAAILAAKSHLALMWPVTSVFLDTSRKIYPTIITADRMKSPPACQSHLLLARVSQQLYITARFVRNCFHKLRTQSQGNTAQVSHRNAAKSILYAYERQEVQHTAPS